MPKTVVTGEFEGHTITVENTWLGGMKLFYDDKLIATNNDLFALWPFKPFMSVELPVGENDILIEVYVRAIIFVRIEIKIDGNYFAGDRLTRP